MATNPFNPGALIKQEAQTTARKPQEDLPYATTGTASRDHVRKTLWEVFSADAQEEEYQVEAKDLVDSLENALFESTGSDAKTKQYRDNAKNMQLKLKVSSKSTIIILCFNRDHGTLSKEEN
jgi:hypothetical protein